MDSERFKRLRDLLVAALDLPEEERESFIDRECDGDDALRRDALEILALEDPTSFLDDSSLLQPTETSDTLPKSLGSFDLIEPIGRGAAATVWLARHQRLGHQVAIKLMEIGATTPASQIARFEHEPKRVARLNHENVVRVFEVGREGPIAWFAMEWVDGHDLAQELHRARHPNPSRPPILPRPGEPGRFRRIAEVIRDAARALHAAHEQGIVHRDIKPSNLMLCRNTGRMKVTDFGIARDESLGSLTRSHFQPGTPHYMSPEQARSQRDRIDHRTDIYSLGVVLYEALTLRRPYDADSFDALRRQICEQEPQSLLGRHSGVPRDLAVVCHAAMAKEPGSRYVDAAAMAADLDRLLDHEPVHASTPTPLDRFRTLVRRNRRRVQVAVAMLLAILATVVIRDRIRDARSLDAVVEARDALAVTDLRAIVGASDLAATRRGQLQRYATSVRDQPRSSRTEPLLRELDALRSFIVQSIEDLESKARRQSHQIDLDKAIAALILALDGVSLFPDDEDLRRFLALDVVVPSIEVGARTEDGREVGGTVRIETLSPATGALLDVTAESPLPLAPTTVGRGVHRIVIQVTGGRRLEFTRIARFGEKIRIDLPDNCLEPLPADEDMVTIEASELRFADPTMEAFVGRQVVELRPFQIDRTEVSNADYRTYLDATGAPEPKRWPQVLEAWDELRNNPVTDVSWTEAQRYAEWRGARLPTYAEFILAASGSDNWSVPWQAEVDPTSPMRGNVATSMDDVRGLPHGPPKFRLLLRKLRPVSSDPDARSQFGLFHTLGNAAEWTESVPLEPGTPEASVRLNDRIYAGFAYNAQPTTTTDNLRTFGFDGIERTFASTNRGFRCARSLEPE